MEPDVPPTYPPPPPPKRPIRPKITLQIPDSNVQMIPRGLPTGGSVSWGPMKYHGKTPATPGSQISDPQNPHFNPFLHMYHSKASEFMFKQFEDFKDFTMNTAKGGLSAGEKTAFWFYNKLKLLSKRWFTHLFLTMSLVLYSVMGAGLFVTLESPNEKRYDQKLTDVRRHVADRMRELFNRNKTLLLDPSTDLLRYVEQDLVEYEANYTEFMKHLNDNNAIKSTWTFWNAMFYSGTIYTTIGIKDVKGNQGEVKREGKGKVWENVGATLGMSEQNKQIEKVILQVPIIKTESESQTTSRIVSKIPDSDLLDDMETQEPNISLRKRRNLMKNRAQAVRQREKTPDPSRTPMPHEDTPTSDDEKPSPPRNSREMEADNTYEEMRRLVQEQAHAKDPDDLDTEKLLEERAQAANDRRRRSISPFAVQEKEEMSKLERKGSFIDPSNKLLSTNYIISPKDEDSGRRGSLGTEQSKDLKNVLPSSPLSPTSPKEKEFPFNLPTTPKKLEEIIYPDEKSVDVVSKVVKTPIRNENVFTFDDKDVKQAIKPSTPKPETPTVPGELVTKVYQIERTPSKKLIQTEKKTNVEIRERIVRTPSRKLPADKKPAVTKQVKAQKEEPQSRVPPVKPARSKSASRFGSKTSESEMSEDQLNQSAIHIATTRKIMPTPRRFQKNKSPRANRSQSVHRVEDLKVVDKTGTGMSQTSREIIELMQKARARSLSIPKDDPRLPVEYKDYNRNLKTPMRTPTSTTPRNKRGISCPKTIQIISDQEILSGLARNNKVESEQEKHSRQSSGYIDASQSEYTSSCYSSSPSENEYEFDLSERTAELTRKLNILSQETEKSDKLNIILAKDIPVQESIVETKSILRKRSVADPKTAESKESKGQLEETIGKTKSVDKNKKLSKPRWKLSLNWQQFKEEQKLEYNKIILLRNRCVCNFLLLIIVCGLGGMMFKYLEGSFENAYKCGSRNVKRDFIESLWRGSHYLREEDWKSMARKKLYEFEDQLHTAHEAGVTSYSGQRSWNFMNSFVYCLTLLTTIGYGHIAPKTTSGRVATIIYAVIGIPLFLIVLADFGKLFTRIIKYFWAFIRRFYYTRSCTKVRRTVPLQEVMKGLNIVYDVVRRPSQIFSEDEMVPDEIQPPPVERKSSQDPPPLPPKPGTNIRDVENDTEMETPAPSVFEIDDEFNLPISVAIIILSIYIIIGAILLNFWENWSFFESFYFVFVSMSTIGLGDLVPNHPMFMMASILYLIFGLALTSMCINVVQVKLSDTFKQASAKIGATIGLKVAEEDGSLVPITPPPTEIAPVHLSKPKVENNDSKSLEVNDADTKNR